MQSAKQTAFWKWLNEQGPDEPTNFDCEDEWTREDYGLVRMAARDR